MGEIGKYITIQNSSGMPAKNYSYYQEVLDLILPVLHKEGIKIIQLGDKDTPQLNGVIRLCGQTTLAQSYFILRRALLHLGNDSWLVHAACAEEILCVSLYGSTTVANHAPHHFNPDKSIFLESDRKGFKPSFSRDEHPRMIDLIWPEKVAESILKLLNLSFNYDFKTLYIGQFFNNKILESACTDVVDLKRLGAQNLIMRLDINFDLAILRKQLSLNSCQLITDKEIPLQSLLEFRQNVLGLIVKVTSDLNPNFIKTLIENKFPYQLISELLTEELNKLKLSYLDYGVINQIKKDIPDKLKDKDLSKVFLKSGKLLLANGKFFSTIYEFRNNNPILNPTKIVPHQINTNLETLPILWSESEHCIFLEKSS